LAANRQVSTEEGEVFARENNFIFFETSAKNSTNVKEMFRSIAQEVPNKKPAKQPAGGGVIVEDEKNDTKEKCKVC